MLTVNDIMTTKLVTLTPSATLHDAHMITKDKGIRHIPIVDNNNTLLAIVTQKVLITNVIQILSDFGEKAIERKEKHTDIMNVAETDFDTVSPERPIAEVAEFFLINKHGCLPVVDENKKLLGIITSSDFVRLSITLLNVK